MSHGQHPVVIVGGGFAGVYAAKHLLSKGIPVLLISQTNHFTFTPLLHEVATGSLISHDAIFEYESFFRSPYFRFIRGQVTGIDRQAKEVLVGESRIPFTYLLIATGSTTQFYGLHGTPHAYVLKTMEDAVRLKQAILARAQDVGRQVNVCVVGGGPTGLELIFEIDRMLRALTRKQPDARYRLRLIHASDTFCRTGGERLQQYISRALRRAKIEVVCNAYAQSLEEGQVTTTVGSFPCDIAVVCAGVRPNTDPFKTVLQLDPKGHIPVHASLQSMEDPHIFAVGDVITLDGQDVPKLAQTAVREAPVAAENIARLLRSPHATLKTYRPSVIGMLFSLGFGDGVGTIGPVLVKGVLAWYLWRTVYLFKTPGLGNKLRVAFSWTMGLFQGRNLTEM